MRYGLSLGWATFSIDKIFECLRNILGSACGINFFILRYSITLISKLVCFHHIISSLACLVLAIDNPVLIKVFFPSNVLRLF